MKIFISESLLERISGIEGLALAQIAFVTTRWLFVAEHTLQRSFHRVRHW
jgi:hypothetical protein